MKTDRMGHYVDGRYYPLDKVHQARARAEWLTRQYGRRVMVRTHMETGPANHHAVNLTTDLYVCRYLRHDSNWARHP